MPLKRLYFAANHQEASIIADRLKADNIICQILGSGLEGALGELPFQEVRPAIWVEELDYPRAQNLLQRYLSALELVGSPWTCAACDESVDGNMGECWNCSTPKP